MNYIFLHLLDNEGFYSSLMHGTDMKILIAKGEEEGKTGESVFKLCNARRRKHYETNVCQKKEFEIRSL